MLHFKSATWLIQNEALRFLHGVFSYERHSSSTLVLTSMGTFSEVGASDWSTGVNFYR